jgi:Na+-transporting NADH:ubiquinone oxidoreductase subunit D
MAAAVIGVLVISSLLVSLLRRLIPDELRIIVFMLIISTFVITADFALKILVPEVSRELGAYVGLIITNCILMGRAEAFAIKNPPGYAVMDALGSGAGYGAVIILIALVREFLASGSLFGLTLVQDWQSWGLAARAPGAFFVLAGLLMVFNLVRLKLKKKSDR